MEQEFRSIKERARAAMQSVAPQLAYLNAIREVLPRDGFFCEEISQVGFAARFGFPVYQPRQYVTCGYQDNLGFGFNTALGVKLAHPDRAVIAVSGDGGFLYGVQELATAVQYGINVVSIVFNNSAYGNVWRDQQERYGGRLLGVELRNPDFVKLAQSFGAVALRAENPAQLKTALESALAAAAPVLIEVPCPRGSESSPWPFLHPPPPPA
jgi:acetolactate synthase-1/2/3 large subunit